MNRPDASCCPECGIPLQEYWPKGFCIQCSFNAARHAQSDQGNDSLRHFGDYELLEEIARGGMGVIYRARQLSLNRIVALKMILAGQFASKQEVLRFRSEAEAAANLQHPNIVRIHETGEHDGHHYFSMDYVEGRTLAEMVRDGPLAAQRATKYACQIAEAIHYAHSQGVLHRDLKPSNIIIDKDDKPRVTDFGLAKRMRDNSGVTVTGQVLGTPNFMPPEQTSAKSGKVGPASDVYALGGILYYLLTTRPPFQAGSLEQVITQVLNVEPISPRLLNPSMPKDLETITLKCLEKEPSRRYQTAQELADELNRFQQREPIHARPTTAAERAWRWSRRKPALAMLVVSLLLVGAAGLAGILWQWRRAQQHAERAEARAYASDMNLAQQALSVNNLGRALELLNRHRPQAGQSDRRGWEWRYLWQQMQSDEMFTLCQKPISIFSLAVSRDERLLAVGERNMGHLTLWNLSTREEMLRLPEGVRPDIVYIRAAFSPTEPLLAYGSASGSTNDAGGPHMMVRVRLLNYLTQEQVAELPLEHLCSGLAFSPDGASLVTSTPNFLTVWDVRTATKVRAYRVGSHQGVGTPFAITPDFRLVAQAFGRGQVRVFDLTSGTTLWQTNASAIQIEAVALSSDGELLATTDGSDNAVIHIWNARDGRLISRLDRNPAGAIQLLFAPDNRTLSSGNTDQTIRVWDLSNIQNVPPPHVLIGHTLEVWRLALMSDGKTLISGGKDGSVRFWDLRRPPRRRGGIALSGPFVGWSFSGSEPDLVTCDRQGRVARWSGQEWQTMSLLRETGRSAQMACLLPDRQEVVIAGSDGALRVHRWPDSEPPRELSVFPKATWIWCLHRHGNRLAVGRLDQPTIQDFDVDTWELKESWRAPITGVKSMDFSPDGRYCIMGAGRGHVLVRNMLTGEESSFVDNLPNIGSVAFSTFGDRVAISTAQGFVRLWESGSWRHAGTLGGFLRNVNGLAFSPDGKRLAAGSSGQEAIRLYEMERFQPLVSLQAQGTMFSPTFDSSGDVLGAMSVEGGLHVWRAPSWSQIEAAEKSTVHPGLR